VLVLVVILPVVVVMITGGLDSGRHRHDIPGCRGLYRVEEILLQIKPIHEHDMSALDRRNRSRSRRIPMRILTLGNQNGKICAVADDVAHDVTNNVCGSNYLESLTRFQRYRLHGRHSIVIVIVVMTPVVVIMVMIMIIFDSRWLRCWRLTLSPTHNQCRNCKQKYQQR